MQAESEYDCSIQSKARFRTVPSDELVHRESIVSPRSGRTEAVEDGGLGMVEIRQAENDPATVGFRVLLAHTSGLLAAGMPFMH